MPKWLILCCTGRNYEDKEDARRKHIFSTNVKRIEMHNFLHSRGMKSFMLGITPFTDMVSREETLHVVLAPKQLVVF